MVLFFFNAFVLFGLFATAVLVVSAILIWRYLSTFIGRVAMVMLGFGIVYSFFFTLSLGTADPAMSIVLLMLQIPFRIFLPVLSFLLILIYIGEIGTITPRILVYVCTIPVIVLAAALTAMLHPFYVSNISPLVIEGVLFYTFTPGPVFWLQLLYSSVLIVSGLTLIISRFFHAPSIYRLQIAAILAAFVAPFFIHLSLIFAPGSGVAIFSSLVAFIITGIAVYVATSRYQFLTLIPVAFSTLFDRMNDGVVIVNGEDMVVEANPSAGRILSKDRSLIVGQPAGSFLQNGTGPDRERRSDDGSSATVTIPLEGVPHFYDLREIPLVANPRIPGGKIIMLHDSQTRHLTELGLRRSNEKLQLLTSITRHDILNTLTVLWGSLQLARTGHLPDEADRLLATAEESADLLRRQIEFTRDYQTLGLHSARWQNVRAAIAPHLPVKEALDVSIDPFLSDVEVFADPMFGRVFYNLIDNTLRHGTGSKNIRVLGSLSGNELLITYEDDGAGIAQKDKERIFEKGYGKNSGLGLFLIREILSITGIAITETGTEGEGVRFNIQVPPGMFRIIERREKSHTVG